MIGLKSQKLSGDKGMPKTKDNINTSIQVPSVKYALLERIKKETDKPISKLVVEGIDLIILKYEDVLKENMRKAASEANEMQSIINSIKDKQ